MEQLRTKVKNKYNALNPFVGAKQEVADEFGKSSSHVRMLLSSKLTSDNDLQGISDAIDRVLDSMEHRIQALKKELVYL